MRAARPSCATTMPWRAATASMRAAVTGAASMTAGACAASGPRQARHASSASSALRATPIIERSRADTSGFEDSRARLPTDIRPALAIMPRHRRGEGLHASVMVRRCGGFAAAFIHSPSMGCSTSRRAAMKGYRRPIMSIRSSVRRFVCIPMLVAGLSLLLAGCGVNNIPSYEESAKAQWSQVLIQYQRRADLIPNLVETVKGYAAQERQVLEEVTKARARATQVQLQIPPDIVNNPEAFKRFQEAQAQLTGALGRLLAVSERYPDLKSNQSFLALQSQLEGTENRIAVARRDYIEAVRQYN